MQAKPQPTVIPAEYHNQPTPIQKEYLSIKEIQIIMGWPKSRARDLMQEFYRKGLALKFGRSYSLNVAYFHAWRDQQDQSISSFKKPLKALKGGKS